MKFELPPLPYSYDALEPYIDKETMEIHYTKHHQTYLNNLNTVLAKYPETEGRLEDMLMYFDKSTFEEKDKIMFRNNAGGFINHNLYWDIMGPKKETDETLRDEIKKEFGSVDEFKKLFSDQALKHFGSGWGWLVRDKDGELEICTTSNQDSPYLIGHSPIIGIDVWEHAYYLKYQNRRQEYIENWWKVFKLME